MLKIYKNMNVSNRERGKGIIYSCERKAVARPRL